MTQVLILVFFLFVMLAMPFSAPVRKAIFARDDATCQECGRKWGPPDYVMLHCAHYDHDRNKKNYNYPESGRLLCVDCHIADHERLLKSAKTQKERNQHAYAIRKLRKCDKHNIHYK